MSELETMIKTLQYAGYAVIPPTNLTTQELAALRAENERLREIERKALEQSEYIQKHALTEWELYLKDAEIARLREACEQALFALAEDEHGPDRLLNAEERKAVDMLRKALGR